MIHSALLFTVSYPNSQGITLSLICMQMRAQEGSESREFIPELWQGQGGSSVTSDTTLRGRKAPKAAWGEVTPLSPTPLNSGFPLFPVYTGILPQVWSSRVS